MAVLFFLKILSLKVYARKNNTFTQKCLAIFASFPFPLGTETFDTQRRLDH